ncbi:hypothetical protein ACLK10_13360 [Escherichia coli]
MINTLHFTGANVGMVYSSKGIAAIITPIPGIIAIQMAARSTRYTRCVTWRAWVHFFMWHPLTDPDMMFW